MSECGEHICLSDNVYTIIIIGDGNPELNHPRVSYFNNLTMIVGS
mgnify:CR=1 FL=1